MPDKELALSAKWKMLPGKRRPRKVSATVEERRHDLVPFRNLELRQERRHFAWQFLWNFVVAVQRLSYRSENGGSSRFLRVWRPITLVA
jgi:hypothetical protein